MTLTHPETRHPAGSRDNGCAVHTRCSCRPTTTPLGEVSARDHREVSMSTTGAPRHLKAQPRMTSRLAPVVAVRRGAVLTTGAALTVPAGIGGVALAAPASAAAAPAAAPQAAAAPAVVHEAPSASVVNLRYGSTGSLVKTLQTKLKISADGVFGPQTLAAVKSLQSREHITVDGIVGPVTWDRLGGATVGNSPTPTCTVSTVRYRSSGALVSTLQSRLKVGADGIFGAQTLAAVKSFQSRNGLVVDGVVGPATWGALGGFPCSAGGGSGPGGTTGGSTGGGVDPNADYKMPFPGGATYRISQGPNGVYSHHNQFDRYAIDFAMPTGTTVVNSRAGTVYRAGWDPYGGGNQVMIKDASGYCTEYDHLSTISVRVGQSVGQGQRVGGSGSTGNSTGPHLHFSVVDCARYTNMYVPRTVERGTSYPVGVYVTSMNG